MVDGAFQSTPKLGAVIIVWNEEHCLERCFRSIAPIVDEIIRCLEGTAGFSP
jgi:hypothetical protein